jgi:hypothetical protein
MQEQSGFDHPRSDDVKGRQEGGYEGGFGDRGYGDRGDFGDQGIDESRHRESLRDHGGSRARARGAAADATPPDSADATPPDSGGYADQADYGDLPQEG